MHVRRRSSSRPTNCRWKFAIAILALLTAGCPENAPTPPPANLPLEGVRLKLVVVDDPAIAGAIEQLRGEWKARYGGELEIVEAATEAVVANELPEFDAIVYPSALVGTLAERRLLAIAPKETLEDAEFAWSQEFELLHTHEAMWGGDVVALPLGSPVFTLMYRADVLQTLEQSPPKTWSEYQQLAELIRAEAGKKVPIELARTIEPLGPGWAGRLLLARAACYAKHHDNFSALFHINSMEPLISGPPFVRALEELVASATLNDSSPASDPTAAREALLSGNASMAITWATAAKSSAEPDSLSKDARLAFTELPGADKVFNVSTQAWEANANSQSLTVPLVSIAGRVASVNSKCEYPEGAFRLLVWLTGPKWSARVSSGSPQTTLFRNTHLKAPGEWVDSQIDSTAAINYAEVVQQSLTRSNGMSVPRIPGEAEYLAALDEAVQASLSGKAVPADALTAAEKVWSDITQRIGVDRQRLAYQRSLGLNP